MRCFFKVDNYDWKKSQLKVPLNKSFKLILFVLFSPIYIDSPAFAMQCFKSGRQEVCYSDITYDYDILDPNWYMNGNCYKNQLYQVMDISVREAQEWHKSVCKGLGF